MTIGILVEGRMEQRIVQRLCPDVPVRLIGTNGRDVTPNALAKRAATLIRLMKHQRPILVIFDREDRRESCDDLREAFLSSLCECDIDNEVIVGIPDKMIENWILACPKFRRKYKFHETADGSNGKAKLKEKLKDSGVDYHETTIGVELFCGISSKKAAQNSKSLRKFADSISEHCAWANR